MDTLAATAMGKLLKTTVPVRVLRSENALQKAKEELEKIKKVRGVRRGRLFPFRSTQDGVLARQQLFLEERINTLSADWIEGVLVALTEAEVWEVRAHYAAIRIHLNRTIFHEGLKEGAQKAASEAIDLCTDQVWIAKWIQTALRKKDKPEERYFTPEEIQSADYNAIQELYRLYHFSFTLTEEELKKLSAPMARN